MLKLLQRNIRCIGERLVVLAAPNASLSEYFTNVTVDPEYRAALLADMQRLRGRVYLQDGAVRSEQLSPDGAHRTPEDQKSWHLLMLDRHRRVSSCVWYLEHGNQVSFDQLRVGRCPLVRAEGWCAKLWHAVESEISRARQDSLHYAEVGGWAVSARSRCTSEGLLLALAAYSLGRTLGGALGITTATTRHSSSTILRRLGGSHLEVDGANIPTYYDPHYGCEMELLRFDSRRPNPKYAGLIDTLGHQLAHVSVVAGARPTLVPDRFAASATSAQAAA